MCLAVPMEVLSREGDRGIVALSGVRREVYFGLVPDARIGDYVLVHAGFVIEKLQKERALEDLQLLRQLLDASEQDAPP